MKKALLSFFVLAWLSAGSVQAAENDVVMRAMQDELDRTMHSLALEKHARPYFVSYRVEEPTDFYVAATFGSLVDKYCSKQRRLVVNVHVGDYKVDSTGNDYGNRNSHTDELTIDNNYAVLRRQIWRSTDTAYKKALQGLEEKRSHLQLNNTKDRPDDWSPHSATVSIGTPAKLKLNEERWANTVTKLSSVFKEFPSIRRSVVSVFAQGETRFMVNSEGTRCSEGGTGIVLGVVASSQADDGMYLYDSEIVAGDTEDDLPSYEVLESKVRALCERLTNLAHAPVVSSYDGPILFEGPAASGIFSVFSFYFRAPSESQNIKLFRLKLDRRVLPKFISLVDDPQAHDSNGKPLLANYQIDDDGVPGERVTLVDKGVFKHVCMSRFPTRIDKVTNGHSQDGLGTLSNLLVIAEGGLSHEELKAKLIQMGKDEGLDTVMIAKRLSPLLPEPMLFPNWLWPNPDFSSRFTMSMELPLPQPEFLYEVSVKDGQEKLVRGGQFSHVGLRLLKDIEFVGNDSEPHSIEVFNGLHSIVTPSILLKEIEIEPSESETDKLPVIKAPYFDTSAK